MFAKITEYPVLILLWLLYLAYALLSVSKLCFTIKNAAKYAEKYYLPMRKWERAYIIISLIALAALFTASVTIETTGKNIALLSPVLLLSLPILRPSARLVYYTGGEYYYSDDWFTKNVKTEKPKCIREGDYYVVILKTAVKKQRLIQFNIPIIGAPFFENTEHDNQ